MSLDEMVQTANHLQRKMYPKSIKETPLKTCVKGMEYINWKKNIVPAISFHLQVSATIVYGYV